MKGKRYKRANRLITFFKYNYKFLPPFNVLVDGTFCKAALENKINLMEQMSKYLGEETNIYTSKCVINELEKFGPLLYGATVICKQFEVAPCPHHEARSASECLAHLARRSAKSKTKYFVATQDEELTQKLRAIAGTPVLYIKYNAILLDRVSEASQAGVGGLQSDLERVKKIKEQLMPEEAKKKRKRTKGANPLSCKKRKLISKDVVVDKSAQRTANGKRKRSRKKPSESTGPA